MNTLLMRLASPIQSWGFDSKFETRRTHTMPTKSGVIGMVAAALGRRRNESIDDLSQLRFGVRVDKSGELMRDYHTAKSKKSAYVTQRYYLCDAVFLAGLEGDKTLLSEIDAALKRPAFPLFLGRRSCPPEGRVSLGIQANIMLEDALRDHEWQLSAWIQQKNHSSVSLPIFVENNGIDGGFFRKDNPISYNHLHRKFGYRKDTEISPKLITNNNGNKSKQNNSVKHDPMSELMEE